MPAIDDFDDDEEGWNDDDSEPDESDTAPCPECGKPVEYFAAKCPACGYWILETDRQAMWARETGQPFWIKAAAAIVLVAMLGAALLAFC